MKKKRAILVLVLVMCAVFLLAACNSGASNPLLGKWKDEATGLSAMDFKDDGTADFYFNDQLATTATYKVDGNKITMTAEGQTASGTFKIEGNKLTLTNADGESQVYVKE